MPFLSPEEFRTHINLDDADAISDGDVTILPTAIAAAIEEAKGYMSRYDYDELFAREGDLRDPILMLHIKNIALWHFIILANPNINFEIAKARYEQAIKWLDKVQSGRNVPAGWPSTTPEERATFFHVTSVPKRGNHY